MIGLLTDSKIVNLPLMKVAKYYKGNVEWYYPYLANKCELLYVSKIFKYTKIDYLPENYLIGGTGHDLTTVLPDDIEACEPDYSIYPGCDYSIQFFSRGCIRKCSFCLVPLKEGKIHTVKPLELNPKGKHIRVLDNNFFANPEWREAIRYLVEKNQPVGFDGIDIRIFRDEHGEALQKIKIYKSLHIAWDNPKDDLTEKIKLMIKYVKSYKITVYVLIGFDSTPEEDLYRVMKIREFNCNPFVMPYNKKNRYQMKFARWVNRKTIFKVCTWEEYDKFN